MGVGASCFQASATRIRNHRLPLSQVRSPAVKKGRHRRFEEARKLKQAGPSAFDLGLGGGESQPRSQDDEYAALAEKYGVVFDDEDEIEAEDEDDDLA